MTLKIFDLLLGTILARFYRWMALAGLRLNMNRVTQNLWVGGINHQDIIVSESFDAVLDLRNKDSAKYSADLEENGIEYLNIKIPDKHGAPPDVLIGIVEWIAERAEMGKKILVHCNLGRGRAALAAAAFLVYEGATVESVIKRIKDERRVTFINAEQKAALEKFSDYIFHR